MVCIAELFLSGQVCLFSIGVGMAQVDHMFISRAGPCPKAGCKRRAILRHGPMTEDWAFAKVFPMDFGSLGQTSKLPSPVKARPGLAAVPTGAKWGGEKRRSVVSPWLGETSREKIPRAREAPKGFGQHTGYGVLRRAPEGFSPRCQALERNTPSPSSRQVRAQGNQGGSKTVWGEKGRSEIQWGGVWGPKP